MALRARRYRVLVYDAAQRVEEGVDVVVVEGSHLPTAMELLRSSLAQRRHTPVMLMAPMDADERIEALNHGATDAVTTPFSVVEVVSRVAAILSRVAVAEAPERARRVCIGGLEVDFQALRMWRLGQPIEAAPRLVMLLHRLWQAGGRMVPRDVLRGAGTGPSLKGRTLDNLIVQLRSLLGDESRRLHTHYGDGYMLRV
jgi:DNA-binding response OmpR family regulator